MLYPQASSQRALSRLKTRLPLVSVKRGDSNGTGKQNTHSRARQPLGRKNSTRTRNNKHIECFTVGFTPFAYAAGPSVVTGGPIDRRSRDLMTAVRSPHQRRPRTLSTHPCHESRSSERSTGTVNRCLRLYPSYRYAILNTAASEARN